jgi:hypothetical protein
VTHHVADHEHADHTRQGIAQLGEGVPDSQRVRKIEVSCGNLLRAIAAIPSNI